jgi:hypothetical protein
VRGRCEITRCPEYNWATLFLGGYKYRDLAFQVGGVSNETVKVLVH